MIRYEVYGQENNGEEEKYPTATFLRLEDAKKYALEQRGKIAHGVPAVYSVEKKEFRTRIILAAALKAIEE